MSKTIVISLGGSLVSLNGGIDTNFVRSFKEFIIDRTSKEEKFFIITGGGTTCRQYQKALKEITSPTSDDLDWMGIYSTRLNAELVRLSFGDKTEDRLIIDTSEFEKSEKKIILGGGSLPGWTSDCTAISIAKDIGATDMINLSNIDYLYDSDPKTNPEAKKIEKIKWSEFRKLIPSEHEPGGNTPFDPVAAKIAEEEGITVAIMDGRNFENFGNYLDGKDFVGTEIK